MIKLRTRKFYYLIFVLSALFSTLVLYSKYKILYFEEFHHFNNSEAYHSKIIPNIVHYVIFGQNKLNFAAYLSILSSIKFQKPTIIYIHANEVNFNGNYWNKIQRYNNSKSVIKINYLPQPTHVYGQPLSSIYHATDVARIIVLQRWGGIYMDTDVLLLKSLDLFRHYEMVVGWPENEYFGTQIMLAHKKARFLMAWLQGYQRYNPTNWYYNAGQYPTEQILLKMPHLAHRVKKLFGVQNLLDYLYQTHDTINWKEFYALHLLSRHPPAIQYFNESLIKQINNTFGEIARYVLYDKKL